ncbi:MAG: hypothetical protein AAB488_00850 [Patescibacteria group bacterium]
MTPTQFIKNLFIKIKASFDKDPGKIAVHPDGVWLFILGIFLIINLIIAFLNFYFFRGISRNDIFTVASGKVESLNTISREKLNQALEYLRGKDEKFEYLKTHKPVIIDPSK